MGHIFISYSHKDSSYVHKLAEALEQEGFQVWIDDRIDYGSEWPKVVERNLDVSDGVIVVLSNSSKESDMVQNEVTRARDEKKPIFPLLLEGKNWLIVQAKQFVDVKDGSLPTEKFYKRLESVTPRTKDDVSSHPLPPPTPGLSPTNPASANSIPYYLREIDEEKENLTSGSLKSAKSSSELESTSQPYNKPKTKSPKLKTEHVVAIIGVAATIIVGILGSPLIGKWFSPIPVVTEQATVTRTALPSQIPSYTSTPPINNSTTLTYTPTFVLPETGYTIVDPADVFKLVAKTDALGGLAKEKYTSQEINAVNRTLFYTIDGTPDKPMQWRWYWCATTEEILKQNVNGIDVVFQADGRLIPQEQLAFTSYSYPKDNGGTGWCATFSTVIKDWKPGIYHFVIASTIKSVINDGEATFLPGFQISDFTVKIREPALKTEVVDDKGVPLALVQGSNFQMGGGAKVDQQPIHAVYLDSYYIDAYEVSNASYKACVDAGVCQPPNEISSTTHPSYYIDSKFDNYPVVNVNWSEAETYCKWRDARLPTEAEWEKTARGIGGRTYPWGNLLDCSFANYFDIGGTQCFVIGDTTPADKYVKGVSPFGVYGLVGNVSEWVSDWYSENYYSASAPYNPQGAESGKYRVIRGGSWKDDATSMLPTIRNWYDPESSSNTIGFRCAKDVTTVTPIETMPPGITPTFTATLTNTPEATASDVFVLISINNVAYRGGTASAKIQTQPGIECALAFFLPSGTKSDAGGLGPRTADANGYCSWTWDIAHNVSTGNGSVTIIVGGESKTYPIKIQ